MLSRDNLPDSVANRYTCANCHATADCDTYCLVRLAHSVSNCDTTSYRLPDTSCDVNARANLYTATNCEPLYSSDSDSNSDAEPSANSYHYSYA